MCGVMSMKGSHAAHEIVGASHNSQTSCRKCKPVAAASSLLALLSDTMLVLYVLNFIQYNDVC